MSNDSLEGILSRYGLQTKDLEKNFSRKVIVRLATEAPVDCKTLGQYLNFSEEKLAEIEVRSEDEDQRKVMLFQAWSESKELNLSILVLADTLYHKQRPDLVELLCDIVISTSKSDMGGYLCDSEVNQLCVQGVDFNGKVQVLEEKFEFLYQRLLSTLEGEGISANTLLEALSLVRISTKNEFDSSVGKILQNVDIEGGHENTSYLCYLKPFMTFLNCGLLLHLITKFGDAKLRQDMMSYTNNIELLMKETTIEMVADLYPHDIEPHMNYTKLMVNFNESPKTYTLERLNSFRAKFCKKVWQSEHMFGLLTLEAGSSFFATWLIPTVITTKLIEATLNHIDQKFYQDESITLVSLEDQDSQKVLYSLVFSGGMSTESAEWTITSLSKILDTMLMSSDKLISLNVLQQMSVLLEALTSLIPTQSHIELHEASDSRSTIRHCSNVADLEGILCKLQIKVISDFPSIADSCVQQYWYSKVVQSAYMCFRYLKVTKLIHVDKEYFYRLLTCTLECLRNLQLKKVLSKILLMLFRITYACLSGIPIKSLAITDIACAVIHYFHHSNKDVQVAAMNAGQFLIPYIQNFLTRQCFILSDNNVHILVCSFGKLMPVSSSLKLLHSFSLLQENCVKFIKKGVPLLSTSILVLSPRRIEKELAFHLLRNMFQVSPGSHITSTEPSSESNSLTSAILMHTVLSESKLEALVPTENVVRDVFCVLNVTLKRVIDDDLSSSQVQYTDLECLLKYMKRTLPNFQRSEVEEVSSLLVQCAQMITRDMSKQTSSEQLNLSCSLVFSVYDFWHELASGVVLVAGKLSMHFPSQLQECVEDIMKYLHTSGCTNLALTCKEFGHAYICLLKTIDVAVDHFSFAPSIICEVVQDCARMFTSSFSSDIRIVCLSIIHKLHPNSGLLKFCICAITDIDIETILLHLKKQSLLPALELLCVLDIATQYGKVSQCHKVIEILNTTELDEQKVKAIVNTLLLAAQGKHLKKTPLSIIELLPQLVDYLGQFRSVVTQTDILCPRQPFAILKGILNELDQIVSQLEDSESLPQSVIHELNDLLFSAMNDLLPAVVETSETQYQRWGNFIIFSCWKLLKELRKRGVFIHKRQGQCIIDTMLQAVSTCITRDKSEEISLRTIDMCLGVFQDFMFDDICDQLGVEEFSRIKDVLVDTKALLKLPAFRFELQLILAFLHVTEESELKQELILDQFSVTNLIPLLRFFKDVKELKILLKKLKALSNIAENRQLFRNCGILQCLGTLLEQFAHSTIESSIAELICVMLSDAPDTDSEVAEKENVNAIAMFEEFMTCTYDGKQEPEACSVVSAKEILQATCSVYSEKKSDSEFVTLHAECMHGLMVFTKDAFQLVLNQPDQVIKIDMIKRAAEHLKKLCIVYEQDLSTSRLKISEQQVIYVSKKYFPEMFCVSFKALQDVYSTSISGIDHMQYITLLLEYLRFLHFVVEQWSRMDNVQEILLKYGAFFLLLNELHTASITPVLDENLLYSVLTALYNIALKSEYSLHFRIVITKQLLNQFMASRNPALSIIAKFCFSCFHGVLSRSEMNQLTLDKSEVDMLKKCLKGVDKFFGGFEQLLLTISKLTSFPNNWKLFTEEGFVQVLMSLALTRSGFTQIYAVKALLNMIPEPVIVESRNQSVAPIYKKPQTNEATMMITESPTFMEFLRTHELAGVSGDLLHGIKLLTQPLENPDTSSIAALNRIERYSDCWQFCDVYLSKVKDTCRANRQEVMFYKAKSMSRVYNKELPEMIEKSQTLPGFEYKNAMRIFCRKRILEVIQILTNVVNCSNHGKASDLDVPHLVAESADKYNEMVVMLDKALLDYLVFNTAEVQTCLLCHAATRKLVHSHYIPKSIIQEFIKAMGLDPGESIYIFAPTGHPSDWYYKSAAKLTFSMLCKSCDGKLLSKDENSFKKYIFDRVYTNSNPESVKSVHTIPYGRYLLRFAAGLFFRNIAPLYSQVCAEIGTFMDLHHLMQLCRSIVFEQAPTSSDHKKFFLLALPSSMPDPIAIPGWDNFVATSLSPYLAYKLLRPGKPIIPKQLLCCMVKIGVLVFFTSFDHDLEMQLLTCASQSLIQSNNTILYIPKDGMRSACIPEKLWWSLAGWARKEVNTSLSTGLSIVPQKLKHKSREYSRHSGQVGSFTLTSDQSTTQRNIIQGSTFPTVVANMLPPGFSINFNEHDTLPEKVINLPPCHTVLLHQPFQTSNRAECFAILCKLKQDNTIKERKKNQPAYSWSATPYILMYFQQIGVEHNTVIKVGFYINEVDYSVEGALPGCPPKMIESPHLQEIIIQVPRIVHSILRSKGFLNMKSLLFWHESLRSVNVAQMRIPCTLDTRCWQKNCNYCDMRCDCCLQPCLHRYEIKSIVNFNTVQSCSKECSNILFNGHDKCVLRRIIGDSEQFVLPRHMELYRGEISLNSQRYPGLCSKIIFSICQSGQHDHEFLAPSTKYIKLWQRSLEKPFCVEYIIDDQFNAVKMIHFQGSKSTFSPGEEIEMVHQFHDILVSFGIPYRLMQMEVSTLH